MVTENEKEFGKNKISEKQSEKSWNSIEHCRIEKINIYYRIFLTFQ